MLRTAHLAIAAAVTLVALATPTTAYFGSSCSAPRKPFCVDSAYSFKDKSSYGNCRRDVESYVNSVDNYVSCLRDAQRSAVDESNRVVRRFNCMSQGQSICL